MSEQPISNWRDIEPKQWNTGHYVSYMKELGLDDIYLDFYNSAYIDTGEKGEPIKKYLGYRSCSIDRSYAWAIEQKFMVHRCSLKDHTKEKHSILDSSYPIATWVCPTSGAHSTSPMRWKEYMVYVPVDFKNIDEIFKLAGTARTWFWELSLIHNNFRNVELYPVKEVSAEEYDRQWERVISHPYILEIDATKEDNNKRRRLLKKEIYLESANTFIDKINMHLIDDMHIDYNNIEWWWSGNGLYCITNPWLNSFVTKKVDESLSVHYKKNIAFWNNHVDLLEEKMKTVKFLKIDAQGQHLRKYIKTPFSLHQEDDVLCTPLTCLFGGNDKIDLTSDLFKELIYPKNLTKEIIQKYFITEEKGIPVQNFLRFNTESLIR